MWQLASFESLADDIWNVGQVETNGERVTIEALQPSESVSGYAAVDEITFVNTERCETVPPEAEVKPSTKSTTPAGEL